VTVVAAVKAQDLHALTRALAKHDGPIPAPAVVGAAQRAWKPGLALLVKHGADLNASARNYRPLHALIQEEPHAGGSSTPARVKCLEWMLAHGADPEQAAAWPSARALVIAAFVGEPAYVNVLRASGAKIDVFTAAALGEAKTVARLVAKDPALAQARDAERLTALQCCAGSRMGATDKRIAGRLVEIARTLVEAGADVNVRTPSWGHDVNVSYFVIRSGQVEMLEYLLDHGLDATAAISTAAWDGRADVLDLLLARGARLDDAFDQTRPVLNELVRWGQFKQARLLLARGASPNVGDDRGWTAIHQAASRGNVKMMEDLLAAGGDITRRDKAGHTPLDIARGKEIVRLIKQLRGQTGV
jgi:ankyrin repeat protein